MLPRVIVGVLLVVGVIGHCDGDEPAVSDPFAQRLEQQASAIRSYHCTVVCSGANSGVIELFVDVDREKARMKNVAGDEITIMCMNCLQDETVSWYRYGDAVAEQFALSVYDLPDRLSNAAAANWIPDARTFGFSPHSIHFLPPVFFASEPRARFFDAFVVDSVDAIQFEGAAAEQYVFVPTAANEPEGSRFTVVVPLAQPRLPVRLLSEFDGIRQELSVRYAEWMSSGIYYVSERRFEHGVNGDLAFSQSAEIEMHSVNLELPSTVFNVDPDGVIPDGTLVQWANSQTAPVESELAVWRDGRIVAAGVDDVTGGYIPEPSVGRSRMILLVGINLVLVAVAMAWLRRRVKRGRGGSIS